MVRCTETANREIWKYPLEHGTEQHIRMPKGAEVLTVQIQNDHVCMWAEVSPDEPLEERRFHVIGTGHRMPADAWHYLGTIQQGPFVWHIYEGE